MQQGYTYNNAPVAAPPFQRPNSNAQPAHPSPYHQYPGQAPIQGQYLNQAPPQFHSQQQHAAPQGQWAQAPNLPPRQQQWQSIPGPPPSAPPPPQVSTAAYNPVSYGPMPGAQQTPTSPLRYDAPGGTLGPAGLQSPPPADSHFHGGPPLPPRPLSAAPSSQSQSVSHATPQPLPPPAQQAPLNSYHQGNFLPSQHQLPVSPFSPVPQNTVQAQPGHALAQMSYAPPVLHHPPPPPPPLPHGYRQEVQQNQQASPLHPPYSTQPQTHRYDPHYQQGHPNAHQHQPSNASNGPYSVVGQIAPQPPAVFYSPPGAPPSGQDVPQRPQSAAYGPPQTSQPAWSPNNAVTAQLNPNPMVQPDQGVPGQQPPRQQYSVQSHDQQSPAPDQQFPASQPGPTVAETSQPVIFNYDAQHQDDPASGGQQHAPQNLQQRPPSQMGYTPHQSEQHHTFGREAVQPPSGNASSSDQPYQDPHAVQSRLDVIHPEDQPQGDYFSSNALPAKPTAGHGVSDGVGTKNRPESGISANALDGVGGPSDWEHFGASEVDENVDDIREAGVRKTVAAPSEFAAELDSETTPPRNPDRTGSVHNATLISADSWPSPSQPAPLNPSPHGFGTSTTGRANPSAAPQGHYVPTPPPGNQPMPEHRMRGESVVSNDDESIVSQSRPNIDETILEWKRLSRHENLSAVDSSQDTPGRDVGANETLNGNGIRQPAASEGNIFSAQKPLGGVEAETGEDRNDLNVLGGERDQSSIAASPDLDNWYQLSLDRYKAMLTRESQAATNEDRTKIFTDFMMQESRLRGVRYGAGIGLRQESINEEKQVVAESQDRGRPVDTAQRRGSDEHHMSQKRPSQILTSNAREGSNSAEDDDQQYSPGGRPLISSSRTASSPRPVSQALVQSPISSSPAMKAAVLSSPGKNFASIVRPSPSASPSRSPGRSPARSPGQNELVAVDIVPASRKSSNPSLPSSFMAATAGRPVYKPFRYGSTSSDTTQQSRRQPSPPTNLPPPSLSGSQQQYQPYSKAKDEVKGPPTRVPLTPRRPSLNATLSGRTNSSGPAAATGNFADATKRSEPNGFEGVRRDVDMEGPSTSRPSNPASVASFSSLSVENAKALTKALQAVLPSGRGPKSDKRQYVATIRRELAALPEDFQFISDLYGAWEKEADSKRKEHEAARRQRQEKQDEKEDDNQRLFADNQIGYGDLKDLERGFKMSELEIDAREETEEFQLYTNKVFTPTYARLQSQIAKLMEHYLYCVDLMKGAVAGREALESTNDRPDLAQVMDVFLEIDRKVEVRQAKVVEAIAERDKKCKASVLRPLYKATNVAKMKEMEKHFDEAERNSALDAARKKLERANALMDAVEQNAMHGLGTNRDYMETVSQAIARIGPLPTGPAGPSTKANPPPSSTSLPSSLVESLQHELNFARSVLSLLTNTAETLMNGFQQAASAVNAGEHDVALASARHHSRPPTSPPPSSSSAAVAVASEIARIRADKAAEDERLAQELAQRVRVVRADFNAVNDRIDALTSHLSALGRDGGADKFTQPLSSTDVRSAAKPTPAAGSVGQSEAGPDSEHRERIQRALDAAKMRNAAAG
ncbi:MAG: hypothetical protein M1825_004725 [Sarcosagium campestre]|nr:MAG: hypothetical protein M1825_004725 [Sarcosagium campestre]